MTTPESLTREQLYELVWREPMLKVAESFGVSSSYLARVCTELRVPRPERGYWAKLEFGKQPQRPELPSAQADDLREWKPGAAIGTAERATLARRRAQAKPSNGIEPGDRRHELLTGVRPHFLKTRESDTGLLRPFKKHLVDIVVSEKHLDAALDAADVLFRSLEAKGHKVALGASNSHSLRADVEAREVPVKNRYVRGLWSPDRLTVVRIGDVEVGLTLFEMTEAVEMMYIGNSKYVPVRGLTPEQLRRFKEPYYWRTSQDFPSGRFALQAYSTNWLVPWEQRWREVKAGQFASMVSLVVKELEMAAPELSRKRIEAEAQAAEERRKREEEWRRAQEEAERVRRAKARQDARSDLLEAIASWEQTRNIHAYFQAVEQQIAQLTPEDGEQLQARLIEARTLVGEPDALAQLRQWKAPHER